MAAGRNYYWLGQLNKAADRFEEAIKLDPTNAAGYDQLGWTYHAQGQDTRAIDALEQAISVDATHARAWGRLGTIYYLRQNYEEALKILPTAIELSENEFLARARRIEIFTQVDGASGPETVPVLQGRLEHNLVEQTQTLTAKITPIQWAQSTPKSQAAGTCGQLIARNINEQVALTSPIQDIAFNQAFSQTTGTATLNMNTGEVSINLNKLPRPQAVPYEVKLNFRPDTQESLGYIQPDANNQVNAKFTITTKAGAPVEYYYELGLSYAYLRPPQCEKAVPWLLKAVKKDPAYFNPAWEGLRICPSEDSPPTPLPTATPTPEENTGS